MDPSPSMQSMQEAGAIVLLAYMLQPRQASRHGVDTLTPLLHEVVSEIHANPVSFMAAGQAIKESVKFGA